ncbi:hypothetical protein K402DRAFT_409273 [Aulographum hederae CBS 113979]|uniref:Restriction endonuclease type IV Mrr domain-containing protein n=1 Tax=Aulographum hederae CBS 113979 TaxID=1176131 RepID=A0A6G1HHF6_9PEZI|nr:hypothetical protein K402DRAFT_409273 [Aulographum hederae CBS 113979]
MLAAGGSKQRCWFVMFGKCANTESSRSHQNLSTFLTFAKRHKLSTTSTVYIGTHYEYTVQRALLTFGFHLTRVAKSSDLGIDLVGKWSVPSMPIPIRVIVQCKARGKRLSPENARELEGAFSGAPGGYRGDGVIALLVAAHPATKGMREALRRSKSPMGFLQVSREGQVLQFIWNHVATESGLQDIGVSVRYQARIAPPKKTKETGMQKEIIMTWKGWEVSKPPEDAGMWSRV